MADAIAELIDIEGIEPAGRLALAFGIVGLAEASARHWSLGGSGLSLDEVVEHVSDLAWHGLRAAAQARLNRDSVSCSGDGRRARGVVW